MDLSNFIFILTSNIYFYHENLLIEFYYIFHEILILNFSYLIVLWGPYIG